MMVGAIVTPLVMIGLGFLVANLINRKRAWDNQARWPIFVGFGLGVVAMVTQFTNPGVGPSAQASEIPVRTEVQFDIQVDASPLPVGFAMKVPTAAEKAEVVRAIQVDMQQRYGLSGVTVDYDLLSAGGVWLTETIAYQDSQLMFANYAGATGASGITVSCTALAPVRKNEVSLKQCAERVGKELGPVHEQLIENPNG